MTHPRTAKRSPLEPQPILVGDVLNGAPASARNVLANGNGSEFHPDRVNELDRYQLYFGPYEMPKRVQYGSWVQCRVRGKTRLGRISDGRIPWPQIYGNRGLLVFGGLVEALETESGQAIAYHWGVSVHTVSRWKRVLGIVGPTEGTRETVRRWREELARRRLNPRRSKIERPILTRELLRRRIASDEQRRTLELAGFLKKPWTDEEIRLLGKRPDGDVAKLKGRTEGAVKSQRAARRIKKANPRARFWTLAEEALLRSARDLDVARATGRTIIAVEARRTKLHIPNPHPKIRKWTRPELDLLGKLPDAEVARKLGRSTKAVSNKRVKLRKLFRFRRTLTRKEVGLLGTMPDASLASKLGRTIISIAGCRRQRRIPAFKGRAAAETPRTKKLRA
jgi:hypothetical protein